MDVFQLKYTGLICGCVLCVLVTTIFYYLVTAVHNFGSMLVIKSTSSKWRLVEVIHVVTGSYVFDRAYMFFLQRYLGGMGPSHVFKVKVALVSRRQYLVGSSVGTSGMEMLGISAGT